MMFPRSVYRSFNVFLAFTIGFPPGVAFAALTANQAVIDGLFDPTIAAEGASPRNCDAQRHFLNTASQEAIDVARTAVEAIDQVKVGGGNWGALSDPARISASAQAMFGVKTRALREPMTEADARRLEDVQGVYRGIVDLGRRAVDLFCDECLKPAKSPASIIDSGNSQALTWCPRDIFRKQHSPSLAPLKTNQGAIPSGTHIETYSSSLPILILRFLAAVILSGHADGARYDTIEKYLRAQTYGYSKCVFLAAQDSDLATANAESYEYFAMSMWLEEVDWANGVAQQRLDMDDGIRTESEQQEEGWQSPINLKETPNGKSDLNIGQAKSAKGMIDAMTKAQLEYQNADLQKPTRRSHFVIVGKSEVVEL